MLVGVASGAYSSIFIASPVLTHWKEREPVYRRRRARIAAEFGGMVPAYATTGTAAREVESSSKRRPGRRLTQPVGPDGTVATSEFREMVRELHADAAPRPPVEPAPLSPSRRAPEPPVAPEPLPPERDPAADARPEDVVMPDNRPPRSRGAANSRNRRRGRPR
jgi:SecD/SecF fusion protein